jgi:cytochrome c peroxidase
MAIRWSVGRWNLLSRHVQGHMRGRVMCLGGALVLTLGCGKEDAPKPSVPPQTSSASQATVASAVKKPPLVLSSKVLGKMKLPAPESVTEAKVVLGRKLFFDPALSVDGSRSCYSCHKNEDGTGGHEPIAIGAGEKLLTRHAPAMWNVGYLPALYWDGRAASLEAQGTGAWAGGNMGVGKEGLAKKADEIGQKPEYKPLFEAAFPIDLATPDTIVSALSAYQRTLICDNTAWDKFQAGDSAALNEQQKQGWELFKGKARCAECHTPPFFSDSFLAAGGAYHNAGVGFEGKKDTEVDAGRQTVSKSDSDFGAFKTPSLRNVSKSAPYFHDGSAATLEVAVEFMAKGGYKNKNLDPKFGDRGLSKEELGSIVAFLSSLDCEGKLEP